MNQIPGVFITGNDKPARVHDLLKSTLARRGVNGTNAGIIKDDWYCLFAGKRGKKGYRSQVIDKGIIQLAIKKYIVGYQDHIRVRHGSVQGKPKIFHSQIPGHLPQGFHVVAAEIFPDKCSIQGWYPKVKILPNLRKVFKKIAENSVISSITSGIIAKYGYSSQYVYPWLKFQPSLLGIPLRSFFQPVLIRVPGQKAQDAFHFRDIKGSIF